MQECAYPVQNAFHSRSAIGAALLPHGSGYDSENQNPIAYSPSNLEQLPEEYFNIRISD